jgi:hypothetical protein
MHVQSSPVNVQLIASSKHAATFEDAHNFDTPYCNDDCFDEGIGTIVGMKWGVAEPQSFRFRQVT